MKYCCKIFQFSTFSVPLKSFPSGWPVHYETPGCGTICRSHHNPGNHLVHLVPCRTHSSLRCLSGKRNSTELRPSQPWEPPHGKDCLPEDTSKTAKSKMGYFLLVLCLAGRSRWDICQDARMPGMDREGFFSRGRAGQGQNLRVGVGQGRGLNLWGGAHTTYNS